MYVYVIVKTQNWLKLELTMTLNIKTCFNLLFFS